MNIHFIIFCNAFYKFLGTRGQGLDQRMRKLSSINLERDSGYNLKQLS